MTQSLAISQAITNMAQLQERFTLNPADSDLFFPEWHDNLPELTETERAFLDKIKRRFVRHRMQGELAEATVNMLIVAHLTVSSTTYF
ncbi:MAG: hypothetical protein RIB93_15145 [Coleofasciculus sp. D1-CHI-01]|uniref:hypothetical protein n=1 Tax=Coleofasciculus sp. D1-CHI-01 TaxID=3068482 RepID=UPI0032FD0850